MESRKEYETESGLVRWWQKDGAWHVAMPDPARLGEGFFWTAKDFNTRQEAIDYLESGPVYT